MFTSLRSKLTQDTV